MALTAHVVVTRGSLILDVDLEVDDNVCIVGPNGAGKTTLLLGLAGLVPIDGGSIVIDGRPVHHLPPEQRQVGFVFQDHRLFPHLSASENVAFGLRARGVSRSDARGRAATWLARVGVADMNAKSLSGGQAQRVALARALITEPSLLLLDEPLASVDAAARLDLRRLLRDELARYPGTRILVTHDPIEAAALADQLVVLEDGRITQRGDLAAVTARPTSAWVADMVGVNLWRTTDGVVVGGGQQVVSSTRVPGQAFVAFRPNAVTLHRTKPEGSARNVWSGVAAELHPAGDRARVLVSLANAQLVAEVTPGAVADLDLAAGGPVWASVKATDVDAYPA
jgi:molybdate transport system ATP-binding protein